MSRQRLTGRLLMLLIFLGGGFSTSFAQVTFTASQNNRLNSFQTIDLNQNRNEEVMSLQEEGLPNSVYKDRYQVDLVLPLGSQRISSTMLKPVLDFYKGVRLAARAIGNEGIKIDLKVHTIDTTNQGILSFLIKEADSLKQSSLIIGFLQSDQIKPLADFAKDHTINLFSALSPSDAGITDNPYFVLLQPTLETHIQKILDFSLKKFPGQNQILIYEKRTPVQKDALKFIAQHHPGAFADSLNNSDFSLHPEKLLPLLDSTKENLICTNLLSVYEARNLLQRLSVYADSFDVSVFGMPSWNAIPGLTKANSFPLLNIYFSNPFYYIPGASAVVDLVANYKNQFDELPGQFSFRGYEVFYWGAHLLKDYGTIFNTHLSDSRWSTFTHFNVVPVKDPEDDATNYWENQTGYIFHYLNGAFSLDN